MRSHFFSAVIASLTITAISAPAALASGTGGVAPSSATTSPTAPVAPKLHLDPVTSRSRSVAYKGPVYERTATGLVVPYQPASATQGTVPAEALASTTTGGSAPAPATSTPSVSLSAPAPGPAARPELLVPGSLAHYVGGFAAAPMNAPLAIQEIIWAGNELIGLPYIYGGGHASFTASGYDCSGTVSFALHGAKLLASPEDSSEFMHWGSHGIGRWIAIFSNPEHAYMTVAGLRLDTSSADDPTNQQGPRWRPLRPANAGFIVRHPLGL